MTNLSDSLSRPYTNKQTSPKRSVSFGIIKIRSYDRTVGDNPSVSTGPALDFSWEYTSHNDIQLDHFEQHRELSRRSMCELAVRRRERENILKHDFEISRKRIAHCIRSINRTKSQRRQTLNNLKFEGVEECWEKAKRRTLRFVGLKKTTKVEIARLWKNAPKAMEKLKRTSTNEATMVSSMRSFSSSIFDDSFKRFRSIKKKRKRVPKKEPGVDDCKHIMRYSLRLEVKEDSTSTNSRLPNPTTSNVEPVPSRAQENDQEAEVQQETIMEVEVSSRCSISEGAPPNTDPSIQSKDDDLHCNSDHPELHNVTHGDDGSSLEKNDLTLNTTLTEDMESLSISSKGLHTHLTSMSNNLTIVAVEDDFVPSN